MRDLLEVQRRVLQPVAERAIYNTHAYSKGNQGHEFTKVFTDPQRRALIEYLKTTSGYNLPEPGFAAAFASGSALVASLARRRRVRGQG